MLFTRKALSQERLLFIFFPTSFWRLSQLDRLSDATFPGGITSIELIL
jgi:hypothetical protein